MSATTLLSRVVFGLLVLATCTAFFVAQRLKQTDPLVYAVQLKKYVSPNDDDLRDRARLRFRTKAADSVTVEVIDRARRVVRVLAKDRDLAPGPHRFLWNGRSGNDDPMPDGAYRVRIAMARSGRTFVPDKFFVVDKQPPRLYADVRGSQVIDLGRTLPRPVVFEFNGISPRRRAEIQVYRVVGGRRALRSPVASFLSDKGRSSGSWDLSVGRFRRRLEPCFGQVKSSGKARPAPPGSYVIVVRACDAAGNQGANFAQLPPRIGGARGRSGVTLRGLELASTMSSIGRRPMTISVSAATVGRYRYRLRRIGGAVTARGRARGREFAVRAGAARPGLYTLRVTGTIGRARRATAMAPIVIAGTSRRSRPPLLVVYPAIAWQVTNPVDENGDGFSDGFDLPGRTDRRVPFNRSLAGGFLPAGFARREGRIAEFLADQSIAHDAVTDSELAAGPERVLAGYGGVLFAGDQRWIPPRLGLALKRYVRAGGKVAFFGPDALHRTVRLTAGFITGPSQRVNRDVFGESVDTVKVAPAPAVPFADTLGLIPAPTGLFTAFEQSHSRSRGSAVLTAAGRVPGRPALVAYRLDKGLVIRVGALGWQSQLGDPQVAAATRRMIGVLTR